MAGSYPDVPSRRMAWDADGTIMVLRNTEQEGNPAAEPSAAQATDWAREDMTTDYYYSLLGGFPTSGSDIGFFSWIFPELRELDGWFSAGRLSSPFDQVGDVESSGDTTNTVDGTWTQRIANYADPSPVNVDTWREDIDSLAVSNVRGVRCSIAHGGQARTGPFHLYGEISAGETPDRLLWFDDGTDLEFAKPIDYGDVPRGSASDYVVYLKNNSASLSAGSVQVTAEDLYLGSGAWFTFDEGSGFSSTLALASSIGNGASSPNITIRRIIPDAAVLGVHAARAYANVGSWT